MQPVWAGVGLEMVHVYPRQTRPAKLVVQVAALCSLKKPNVRNVHSSFHYHEVSTFLIPFLRGEIAIQWFTPTQEQATEG